MNYSSTILRHDDPYGPALPGPEHVEQRPPEHDPGSTPIGELIAAVRKRAFLLVLWTLLCIGAGVAYVVTAQPEFVAAAQIALEPRVRLPPGADAAAAAAAATPTLDSAQAESQLQVIRSARNLRHVFDTLRLDSDPAYVDKGPGLVGQVVQQVSSLLPLPVKPPLSPEEASARAREIAFQNFSERVQVRRLGQSYVLEVSFRGLTPDDAARITNSIASAYIRDQVLIRAASDQRGTEFLQGRISLIQAQKKAADEAVATGVITDFQFPDSDARIVGAALRPLAVAYPQTKLILLLGAVFGLVSGIGVIAVLHSFDRIIRSPGQVRRMIGVDCLAVVPHHRSGSLTDTTAVDQPASEFARALRQLRTVLFASGVESRYVSVGLVSCQGREGCSALSANLACLLAASNERVVLVDANLQNPDLTRRIEPKATAGLDSLVLSPTVGADMPEVKLGASLTFVPATADGRIGEPSAFLGSHALRAALARINGKRNLIFDLPPLDLSSDAQAIGHLLTGVVLVATLNGTTLDQLFEAVRALRAANGRVIGVVLNDPARSRRSRRHSIRETS